MTAADINRTDSIPQPAYQPRVWGAKFIAALALFFSASFCLAQSDLVRLIPPDAPVIAGMRRLPPQDAADALWLATKNNTDDLNRLIAITETDPDRRVDHVIVADWASSTDNLGNHLLLAKGRFSFANIGAAALGSGATRLTYQGLPVFAIEAAGGSSRWLAVPRPDVAIFGSPSAVQLALDRYRSGAVADSRLLARLRNAHDRDAAWSSVLLDSRQLLARVKLHEENSANLRCLAGIRELDLAIQLGDSVKIGVDTGSLQGGVSNVSMGCLAAALFGDRSPQMKIAFGEAQPQLRVSLARAEYDRWLDTFRKSSVNQTLQAIIAAPEAPEIAPNAGRDAALVLKSNEADPAAGSDHAHP